MVKITNKSLNKIIYFLIFLLVIALIFTLVNKKEKFQNDSKPEMPQTYKFAGSCKDSCGSSFKSDKGKCFCDASCATYKDCCYDYKQQCSNAGVEERVSELEKFVKTLGKIVKKHGNQIDNLEFMIYKPIEDQNNNSNYHMNSNKKFNTAVNSENNYKKPPIPETENNSYSNNINFQDTKNIICNSGGEMSDQIIDTAFKFGHDDKIGSPIPADSAEQCGQKCKENDDCISYTYNNSYDKFGGGMAGPAIESKHCQLLKDFNHSDPTGKWVDMISGKCENPSKNNPYTQNFNEPNMY